MEKKYYKLEIYIPESHFDVLKQALMSAEAGHIGNYDCCLHTRGPVSASFREQNLKTADSG